ncbi:TonB-dependent receptor [Opitutaceae bacterium TAV4]|nr:TonB-dependent receptor [Opitutaceae bacterium TAV4]
MAAATAAAADALPTATDSEQLTLPELVVYSPRVANQESTDSFAMPVTALRYEPLVDVQARSASEAQADVSIRGGTFENTGFSIGAVPIYDPQTGHYLFSEQPVAPAMLGAPQVRTGADNAISGWNATAGSVAYGWQRVQTGGFASVGTGNDSLFNADLYSGYVSDVKLGGRTLAVDASASWSQGDGALDYNDHEFQRYNLRFQLQGDNAQTDLFAGWQKKFFGLQNLYAAPYNRYETDQLETLLVALNHRVTQGVDGGWFQAGAYYRRNVDDYTFDRLAPPPAIPYHHVTQALGAGLEGSVPVFVTAGTEGGGGGGASTAIRYRAGVVADEIDSVRLSKTGDGLGDGRFDHRTQVYAGLFADQTFVLADGHQIVATAGANYDDSNRDGSAVSPVAELAWVRKPSGNENPTTDGVRRVYVSYAESTQLPTYTALNSSPTSGLFRGDRDLGRSKAQNIELGALASVARWDVQAAVFYRHDDDLVDWYYDPANPSAARIPVAGSLDTTGVELVARRSFEWLDLVFGYTWLHKNEDYLPSGAASFYAYNFAEHRLTAALVVRPGAGVEVRMDNELRLQADNPLRSSGDDVILSSLGVYYRVPGIRGLTLSVQVDNLWNTYFEEVPLVPGSPRTWSAGVTYAW